MPKPKLPLAPFRPYTSRRLKLWSRTRGLFRQASGAIPELLDYEAFPHIVELQLEMDMGRNMLMTYTGQRPREKEERD